MNYSLYKLFYLRCIKHYLIIHLSQFFLLQLYLNLIRVLNLDYLKILYHRLLLFLYWILHHHHKLFQKLHNLHLNFCKFLDILYHLWLWQLWCYQIPLCYLPEILVNFTINKSNLQYPYPLRSQLGYFRPDKSENKNPKVA